jgi:outer membrane protein assembly factor BamB
LYLHGEDGEVALAEATPDAYREAGRFTPPAPPKRTRNREQAWPYPVLANGRLYIRDLTTLWSYDVTQ